jgi:hypothetical protein
MKLLPSANTGPVASDSAGNLFVLSSRASAWGFTGPEGRFLAKLNPSLPPIWIQPWNTTGRGLAGLGVDAAGNLYMAGTVSSSVTTEGWELFATRIDGRTGTVVWDTVFGSSDYDHAQSMAVDDAGNTYIVGTTAGSMPGSARLGQYDSYVVKVDPNGQYARGRDLGTARGDGALSVAVDTGGNAYFISEEDSGIKFLGKYENTDNNQVIYKFGPDGSRLWASTYDSDYREGGWGIGVTSQGVVLAMAISDEIENDTGESRRGAPYLRRLKAATGGGTVSAMSLGEGAMARDPVGGSVCSIGRNAAYEKPDYKLRKESILTCFDAAGAVACTKIMPGVFAQLITIDALGVITVMGSITDDETALYARYRVSDGSA